MTTFYDPAVGRNETANPRTAAAANALGFRLERIERRFGTPVFRFSDEDKRLSASTIGEYGAAYLSKNPVIEAHGGAMTEALALFTSEEFRLRRQGVGASAEPSYAREELNKLSREQTASEMPSISAALAAGRVAGIGTPAALPDTQEFTFTRSGLLAMTPLEAARRQEEISSALESGHVNFAY